MYFPNVQSAHVFIHTLFDVSPINLAWTIHETSDYRAEPCACREFREGAEYGLYCRLNEISYKCRGQVRIRRFHEYSKLVRYKSEIEPLATSFGTKEIAIVPVTYDIAARVESYRRLAVLRDWSVPYSPGPRLSPEI